MTTLPPTTLASTLATTSPPTTLAPTTLAPTTLPPTTLAPATAAPRYPENNLYHRVGNDELTMYLEIEGIFLNESYGLADDELTIVLEIEGTIPDSVLIELEDDELTIEMTIEGWGVANDEKKNWVGWSKIGEASFILDHTNDAGFKPMPWTGYVYQVKQLDKNVVIYGSKGITMAVPVASPAPTFGFREISKVGIKNKTAVGGDEFIHYFINILGALYKLSTEGAEYLGFEEFLLPLVNPVMLYDKDERKLYISDATTGYVLSEDILTGGYVGITGLYRIGTTINMAGPEDIEFLPIYIVTDIMDFKRRGFKHIEEIEFGVSCDMPLYAAIDFRHKKTDSFRTTRWVRVNNEGVAKIPCSANEFRIRLRSEVIDSFDLSYIKVHFKYIDQRFSRDPRENPLDAY